MSEIIKLGYWNCRGLGHPIRMLLEYLEIPYQYSSPPCPPPPTFHKKEWKSAKYEILDGYDFPNLPYLEDGDVRLTHHMAIMQYIGRKYGLYPLTEQEYRDVDLIREQVAELEGLLVDCMYFFQHRENATEPSIDEITAKRNKLGPEIQINISDIARKYGKQVSFEKCDQITWMAGNRIMYIDFLVYEQVDYARNLFPDLLDSDKYCPSLKQFMSQFEELLTIKKYMMSDRHQMFPFYSERSYLGRSEDTCYSHLKCDYTRNFWF